MDTEKCPFIGIDCEYIPLAQKSDAQAKEIERLRELEARYWEFASKYDSLLVEIERLQEENNDLKSALMNVLFSEVSHVEITEFTKEKE
jgi:hypothetical protein